MKEQKVPSFFDFFDSLNAEQGSMTDKEYSKVKEKLSTTLQLCDLLKDRIIPLALEQYLGVMEADGDQVQEEKEEDFEDESSDDEPQGKIGSKGNKGSRKK